MCYDSLKESKLFISYKFISYLYGNLTTLVALYYFDSPKELKNLLFGIQGHAVLYGSPKELGYTCLAVY